MSHHRRLLFTVTVAGASDLSVFFCPALSSNTVSEHLWENTLCTANIGSLLGIYRRCLGMSLTYLHMLFTDLTDNKSCCLYTQHNAIKHFLTCRFKVHAVELQSQTSSLSSRVKAITNYVCKRCKFLASESQQGGTALVTWWGKQFGKRSKQFGPV